MRELDVKNLDYEWLAKVVRETSGAQTNMEVYEQFCCGSSTFYLNCFGADIHGEGYEHPQWLEICNGFKEYLKV